MSQVTVGALLFGPGHTARSLTALAGWRAIERRVNELPGISDAARQLVQGELASATAGLLDLDLSDVLIGGWRLHRSLTAAARSTHDHPGSTEVVPLATHRITISQHPYVEISVAGTKLATVHFDVSLYVDVDGLTGTVRSARLVALQGGRCTVGVSLAGEGQPIMSRQGVVLDPLAIVRLGDGIPLLAQEPDVAPR